ncbi:MAG: hypothetical protein PHO92_04425 [Candidatus Peribacteraceae bacterium]|nr:hypothetical protein [Candidatus Peribacteraceae bacterium]
MDTIIERDSSTSAVALFLGILVIAVVGGLALYFLRIYPFNTAQQPDIQIDVTVPDVAPVEPTPSAQ